MIEDAAPAVVLEAEPLVGGDLEVAESSALEDGSACSRSRRSRAADSTAATSRSLDHGLVMKSAAPCFIARTARSTSPYPVIITTTTPGSIFLAFSSHCRPSRPDDASRLKFMSSSTQS